VHGVEQPEFAIRHGAVSGGVVPDREPAGVVVPARDQHAVVSRMRDRGHGSLFGFLYTLACSGINLRRFPATGNSYWFCDLRFT